MHWKNHWMRLRPLFRAKLIVSNICDFAKAQGLNLAPFGICCVNFADYGGELQQSDIGSWMVLEFYQVSG